MNHDPGATPDQVPDEARRENARRPWATPEVIELPRLTDLTLQSPIGGGGDTGGGTVF